jgi:hypothetical protein
MIRTAILLVCLSAVAGQNYKASKTKVANGLQNSACSGSAFHGTQDEAEARCRLDAE